MEPVLPDPITNYNRQVARQRFTQLETSLASVSAGESGLDAAYESASEELGRLDASLEEVARVVRPGGRFIVDVPSAPRRALGRRPASGWHGDTAAGPEDVARWAGSAWRVVRRRGVLFFPIHRVPSSVRGLFGGIDAMIGRTPVGRFSSYHVYELERRA